MTATWQFNRVYARASQTPEKRLMAAILMDALLQFQKAQRARNRRNAKALAELRTWFFGADTVWPFSFENVCAHLGLEPDGIRSRLTQAEGGSRLRLRQGWRRR